jgi:hypothetical protein
MMRKKKRRRLVLSFLYRGPEKKKMSYRENSLMARSKTKRESPLWPINPKFGLEADAENGEWVTRLQGYKVTRLQG